MDPRGAGRRSDPDRRVQYLRRRSQRPGDVRWARSVGLVVRSGHAGGPRKDPAASGGGRRQRRPADHTAFDRSPLGAARLPRRRLRHRLANAVAGDPVAAPLGRRLHSHCHHSHHCIGGVDTGGGQPQADRRPSVRTHPTRRPRVAATAPIVAAPMHRCLPAPDHPSATARVLARRPPLSRHSDDRLASCPAQDASAARHHCAGRSRAPSGDHRRHDSGTGPIWQGRYGTPYHVGLVLLAALFLEQARPRVSDQLAHPCRPRAHGCQRRVSRARASHRTAHQPAGRLTALGGHPSLGSRRSGRRRFRPVDSCHPVGGDA